MLRNDPPSAVALAGVRIVVLRADGRGGPLAAALRASGAIVAELTLIAVEQLESGPIRDAISVLHQYSWVLLTSAHAATSLETALTLTGASFGTRKLAAVGEATIDAVEAMGWPVTVTPDRAGVDGLVDAMASRGDVDGARMLYPAAEGGRDVLPSALRSLGAIVDIVPVYRTVPDREARSRLHALIADGAIDLISVVAPGTMDALLEAVPPEQVRRLPLACVGPVAARAARKAGFVVKVEAEQSTPAIVVRRIVAAFHSSR